MGFEAIVRSVPSGENRVRPLTGKVRIKVPSETCQTAGTLSQLAEMSVSLAEKLIPMNGPKRNGPDNYRTSVQFETFHNLMTSLFPSKKTPDANRLPSWKTARAGTSCVGPTKVRPSSH